MKKVYVAVCLFLSLAMLSAFMTSAASEEGLIPLGSGDLDDNGEKDSGSKATAGLEERPAAEELAVQIPSGNEPGRVAAKQLQDQLRESRITIIENTVDAGYYYKYPGDFYKSLSGSEIAFSMGHRVFGGSPGIWLELPESLSDCRVGVARTLNDFYTLYVPGYEYYRDGNEDVSIIEDISKYTSGFFEENALIIVYSFESGCSKRVERIVKQGNELFLVIQKTSLGGSGPHNAGYLCILQEKRMAIEVSKSDMENVEKVNVCYVPWNDARID